jgi:chemotaxis protein methyltransferase CheR
MSSLLLSTQVFAILSALVEERLGLYFTPEYRDLFAEKLGPRAAERGFESMLDYYYFLRYDPEAEQELSAVADALTVNETYFFREVQQLRVLVSDLLAPLFAQGRRVRVWCAACSTGEEPLTLAALLDERGLLDRTELVASDVSARVLRIASQGAYGQRSLRSLPTSPAWLRREGDAHVVDERLRRAIDWRQVNLLDGAAVEDLGCFDAVICRNVLIYFRDETVHAVVRRLQQAVMAEGVILVGASESLMRLGTALSCEEHGGAFFYRKAASP